MTRRAAPFLRALTPATVTAGLGRLVVCLATLAALFVMHGPSSDHMLEMPDDAAMTVMTSASLTHELAEFHGHIQVSDLRSSIPELGDGGTVAAPCVASDMSHAQCVATLRALPQLGGITVVATTTSGSDAQRLSHLTSDEAVSRPPPPPSLDKLGISRT